MITQKKICIPTQAEFISHTCPNHQNFNQKIARTDFVYSQ